MGRLSDKEKAAREGVTDRAIRKRRKLAREMAGAIEANGLVGGDAADIRWKNARAARAEDALLTSRGELLDRREAMSEVSRRFAECKSRMFAIPDHAAIRFGFSDEVCAGLRQMITDACSELHVKWSKPKSK